MSGHGASKLWTQQRLKASILRLADEGIVLEWAIRRESGVHSPLQGRLRTNPISVARGEQDDSLP